MADKFDNFVDGGYGLKPQSADPTNPKEGDYYHSDGTARPEGLWHYVNGGWAQVGSGNGDLSIYAQFDAEDGDTTNLTNISISATSPIAGDNSYSVDSYTASFPSITMEDRHADKLHALECHYSMTSGTAKLVIKDNSSNVLIEQEIDSTSVQKASLQYYVASSVTSVQLEIQDVSSATGLKIDDLIFSDSPFQSIDTVSSHSVVYTGYTENTGNLKLATEQENKAEGAPIIEVDNSGTETRYTFLRAAHFSSSLGMSVGASAAMTIQFFDSTDTIKLYKDNGNTTRPDVDLIGYANEGDYLVCTSSVASTNNHTTVFAVSALAKDSSIVYHQAGTENHFVARIQNNGTASVISESFPFISSVNRTGAGAVDVTLISGFFAVIPASTATTDADFNAGINQGTLSTTNITVKTEIMDGTDTDADFTLKVHRQGSDYKNPNAYAAENFTKTSIRLVDGVTAPSTETYAQMYVDTADGDLKIKFADGTVKTIVTDS